MRLTLPIGANQNCRIFIFVPVIDRTQVLFENSYGLICRNITVYFMQISDIILYVDRALKASVNFQYIGV